MKKLFICETPMQIIIALAIKKQYINKDDKVDLFISDVFIGYEKIIERIKKLNIFNDIYSVNVNIKNKIQKIKKFYFIFNTERFLKNELNIKDFEYDEMYFWNYDSFSASLRAYFYKKNKQLKTFLFEEAYTIYFPYDGIAKNSFVFKLIDLKNKILHNNLVRDNIDGLFMLEPKLLLYKPKCPVYKINRDIINNKEFKKLIDDIFNASSIVKNYDKKFIIFEEATLANNPNVDDEKVFDKIIDIVGKDNVIIKLHPRTYEDRFTRKGIKTLGNEGIPWEALACVGNFQNKVLIAISSSSLTTYKSLFGNKMNGYLLFKFLNPGQEQFSNKYDKFWEKMGKVTQDGGIHIPKNEKDFFELLKKEVKKNEKEN